LKEKLRELGQKLGSNEKAGRSKHWIKVKNRRHPPMSPRVMETRIDCCNYRECPDEEECMSWLPTAAIMTFSDKVAVAWLVGLIGYFGWRLCRWFLQYVRRGHASETRHSDWRL
jgi:hypothetical protein